MPFLGDAPPTIAPRQEQGISKSLRIGEKELPDVSRLGLDINEMRKNASVRKVPQTAPQIRGEKSDLFGEKMPAKNAEA